MTAVEASSYVSISTAVTYTSPFIGALMADCLLGDYWVILIGSWVFYIPGLFLLALSTVPKLFGETVFPKQLLKFAILFLWPFGAGAIKSVVNIFGARQFHPQLHSAMIESYYVNFYMCINVGALLGGIVIPIIAQHNITTAYFIPVCTLPLGLLIFMLYTHRYVRRRPQGDIRSSLTTLKAVVVSIFRAPPIFVNAHGISDTNDAVVIDKSVVALPSLTGIACATNADKERTATKNARQLINVVYVSMLTVAFNVSYSQMTTVFMIQGAVMKPAAGFIDAAIMHNFDAVSVLLCGFIVANYLYPNMNGKICTATKFAIGSFLGSLAVLCALIVEYHIHSVYNKTEGKISILWQTFSYVLIGAGEIFAVSTAYEVAFAIAPREQKALSSAFNLFCIGAVPNFICIGLFHMCKHWFTNKQGYANIETIKDYSEAHVHKYFWLLLIMNLVGVVVNLMPTVRDWVSSIEEEAKFSSIGFDADDINKEASPFLRPSTSSPPEEPDVSLSHPSKTVLHVGKQKAFVLLNRHASNYGSFFEKKV
jgi:POT family proton-dependent oligopeptide transporter